MYIPNKSNKIKIFKQIFIVIHDSTLVYCAAISQFESELHILKRFVFGSLWV